MSVDDWLKQGYNIEGATKTYFGNEASLEKSEESIPPLKLKNNGGLLCNFANFSLVDNVIRNFLTIS